MRLDVKTLAEELLQAGVLHSIEGDALGAHLAVEPEDWAAAAAVFARSEHIAMLGDLFASDTGDGVELTCRFRFSDLASDVLLRCAMPYSTPAESLREAFPSALICEREIAELFGLSLSGHPDPVRLFTVAGLEPLMRDSATLRAEDGTGDEEPWQVEADAVLPASAGTGAGHSRRAVVKLAPRFGASSDTPGMTLRLAGEIVVSAEVELGFVHRGIEKLSQYRELTSLGELLGHLDGSASVHAQHAAALAVERSASIEVPAKGAWLRCLYAELARVVGHLGWLQGFMDEAGVRSQSARMVDDRRAFLGMMESLAGDAGADYVRPGGVAADMPAVLDGRIAELCDAFERDLEKSSARIRGSRVIRHRLHGLAPYSGQTASALGVTGPNLRACGVVCDVRRDMPYDAYAELQFEVPVGSVGDAWDRMSVRIEEMRQALAMIRQLVTGLPEGPFTAEVACPLRVGPAEAYAAVESGRGELGVHVVTGGGRKPRRVRLRTPSLFACQLAEEILPGTELSDVFLVAGSLDIGLGEADR